MSIGILWLLSLLSPDATRPASAVSAPLRRVVVAVPVAAECKCKLVDNGTTHGPAATCPAPGGTGPYFTVVTVDNLTENGKCKTLQTGCGAIADAKCKHTVDVTLRWQANPATGCDVVCLHGGNLGPPAYQTAYASAAVTARLTVTAICTETTDNAADGAVRLWLGACATTPNGPPNAGSPNVEYVLRIKCEACLLQ